MKPEEILGLHPTEVQKRQLVDEINNSNCSPQEKERCFREIDFMFSYARLVRLRRAIWHWQDERREHCEAVLSSRHEVLNQLMMEHNRVFAGVHRTRIEIAAKHIALRERARTLKPKNRAQEMSERARLELLNLKLRSRVSLEKRRTMDYELENRVVARARFQQRVHQEFPDLEEEMMDEYDRRFYEQSEEEE
jgi:hypothetical protein